MSIINSLIGQLAPHDCLGCGTEGDLLCGVCAAKLRPAPACCYRCRMVSADFLTCVSCRDNSWLHKVRAVTVYEQLAKDLIWKLKFAHAQSAAGEIATVMSPLIDRQSRGNLLVVPVPTATTRTRQRGYDQARLLARELATASRQPYADVLARQNQAHQVGASRQQRLQQLATAFRVTKPQQVRGATILLIDDVVTTGATLESAAEVMKAAGARHIEALVFAQPVF